MTQPIDREPMTTPYITQSQLDRAFPVAHSRKDAEAVASDSLGQPDNLEVIIDAFIEDYEMIGETEDGRDACHTPTEGERALIKDAICGLLVDTDWDNAWGAHIKSLAHPPEAHKLLQQALEALDNSVDVVREEYTEAVRRYSGLPSRKARLDSLNALLTKHESSITDIRTYLEGKKCQS